MLMMLNFHVLLSAGPSSKSSEEKQVAQRWARNPDGYDLMVTPKGYRQHLGSIMLPHTPGPLRSE